MTVQIIAARPALMGVALRSSFRSRALAAICISFAIMSTSTFGADPATGASRATTCPSRVMQADHRPTAVQPNAPPDSKLDYLAGHAQMVDRLYEELMRWTPPACASASSNGPRMGGC